MAKNIVLPTNPADIAKIKNAVKEASDSLLRIDAEKDHIKSIIEVVVDDYGLPKSFVNRMVKTYHKSSYDKDTQDNDDFRALYETVIG